jgi:hypothetical protein
VSVGIGVSQAVQTISFTGWNLVESVFLLEPAPSVQSNVSYWIYIFAQPLVMLKIRVESNRKEIV